MPAAGFEHAIAEFTVVGQKHQTGIGVVEPADREDSLGHASQQMAQRRAALGIGHGGDDVCWLVQQEIARLGRLLGDAAGGFDAVAVRIGFRAEFTDDDAVDAHLPAAD
jgi:hypothetical protein